MPNFNDGAVAPQANRFRFWKKLTGSLLGPGVSGEAMDERTGSQIDYEWR
jgi:hypothetical protein